MRLRDMYEILMRNLDRLHVDAKSTPGAQGQPPLIAITGRDAFLESVKEISKIAWFAESARQIFSINALRRPGDPLYLSAEEWKPVSILGADMISRGNAMLSALSEVLREQSAMSLAIKLPHADTLDDLRRRIQQVQDTIESPVKRIFDESFVFGGFDVGSEWLEFANMTQPVLLFIAGLLAASYKYLKLGAECELREKEIERYAIGNEHLKSVQQANAALLQAVVRKMAEELNEERSQAPIQNENINITLVAIKDLSSLIKEGLVARPALSAPAVVQEGFSRPKELMDAVRPLLLSEKNDSSQ